MIARTFEEYRRVFRALETPPETALEVGALPSRHGLLTSEELKSVPARIGINLTEAGAWDGVVVFRGDARRLPFPDGAFDLVVSASMLEHVPDFWRAVDEMKRVLKPGGTLAVSTPGFADARGGRGFRRLAALLRLPDLFKRGTVTMRVHDAPHDYYRFSEHAYRDVILAGLEQTKVWRIMTPPRIYGTGVKPAARV